LRFHGLLVFASTSTAVATPQDAIQPTIPIRAENPCVKKWARYFLFHGYEIQDAGSNEGEDMSLYPRTALALSDDDVAPVLELSHEGSHSREEWNSLERLAGN
jgi:hypothetical protein